MLAVHQHEFGHPVIHSVRLRYLQQPFHLITIIQLLHLPSHPTYLHSVLVIPVVKLDTLGVIAHAQNVVAILAVLHLHIVITAMIKDMHVMIMAGLLQQLPVVLIIVLVMVTSTWLQMLMDVVT